MLIGGQMSDTCIRCFGTGMNPRYADWPCGFCEGAGEVPQSTNWVAPYRSGHRHHEESQVLFWICIGILTWGAVYVIW